MPISQFVEEDEPPSARILIRLQAPAKITIAKVSATQRQAQPRRRGGEYELGMTTSTPVSTGATAPYYTVLRCPANGLPTSMQQNWTYFLAFAAGAAVLALFFRARRRDGGGRYIAVVSAIIAVIGLLLFFG